MKKLFCVLVFMIAMAVPVVAQDQGCNQSVVINVTAGNTTQLVAALTGTSIYVCGFAISGDTASTVAQFQYGTGTNCGTGTANLTGAMRMAANGNIAYGGAGSVIFKGAFNNAVCLAATTGAVTGVLSYSQR